jgi:hypothetical protein
VNVIQKIITSTALDAAQKAPLIEATKRVLLTLQVSASQSYRRLLEVRHLIVRQKWHRTDID